MKKFLRIWLLAAAALFLNHALMGQTTVWSEDFEVDGHNSTYVASSSGGFNDGNSDHFNRTNGTDIANVTGPYTGFNGTWFWAAEDTDDNGGNGNDEQKITITGINITGYTNLNFFGLFGAGNENGPGNSNYDAADYIRVTYAVDGGVVQNGIWFSYENNGDAFNEPIGLDADFDGEADVNGTNRLGNAMQEFSFAVPAGNTLDITIAVYMDAASEEIAFDNLRLIDLPTGPTNPTVTTNAATNVTATTATLNGTINPNGTATDGEFLYGTTQGGPYPFTVSAAQNPLGNGVTDIAVSADISGLTPGNTYYFVAQATNGLVQGAEQSFVAQAPCNITGISVSNVSTCNNQGPGPADDIYTCDITVTYTSPPTSGDLEINSTTTGQFVTEPLTVSAAGLNPTSHTFFGVEVFANGEAGSVEASFTDATGCLLLESDILPIVYGCSETDPDLLIISEYVEGSGQDKALEIFNPTTSTITLDDYQVRIFSNGSSTPTTTINIDNGGVATLAPGEVWVIVNNSAGAVLDALKDENGQVFINGNDAVELFNDNLNVPADIVGQIGFDPGSVWGGGTPCETAEQTLRKNTLLGAATADADGSDAYDPNVHFAQCAAQDDFSNLGLTSPFPVNLISFDGFLEAGDVRLAWATAREEANERFDLEKRQANGDYAVMTSIGGAGYSSDPLYYEAYDRHASIGKNVYRLVQIDFDGTKHYLGQVEVFVDPAQRLSIDLAPNPVQDHLTLRWESLVSAPATIEVLAMDGRVIHSETLAPQTGAQVLELPYAADWATGMYLLRFRQAGEEVTARFLKE